MAFLETGESEKYYLLSISEKTNMAVGVLLLPEDSIFAAECDNDICASVYEVLKVFISMKEDFLTKSGFNSKGQIRKKTKQAASLEDTLNFLSISNLKDYQGNSGQIKLAGKLGGIRLGFLYDLASGLGIASKLQWTKLHVTYEKAKKFEDLTKKKLDRYKGNMGQIKMAGELDGVHLSQLHSLASGLDQIKKLQWNLMLVAFEIVGEFADKIYQDPKKYKGVKGQIKMAKDLGGINTYSLYTLAFGLNLAQRLGWDKDIASCIE